MWTKKGKKESTMIQCEKRTTGIPTVKGQEWEVGGSLVV